MVDIPHIKREDNLSAVQSPTSSATVPAVDNQLQETVGKVLGAGLDYYHKQMDVAADDYARKGANDYQDEFNQGFHVGHGDLPGLKHVEGLDQFKQVRDGLVDRLNKKTAKLLSDPNISDYAREKLKLKLDDATSTFKFYMDGQEGQVKIKEKATQTKIEQDNHGSQLVGFMGSFIPGGKNALIDMQIEKMKYDYDKSLVSMGLADTALVTNKDGTQEYKVVPSSLGEFQKKKDVSEKIATAIESLSNENPMAALEALKKYGDPKKGDMLQPTVARIEKSLKSSATLQEAYGEANKSVVMGDTPDMIQEKMQKYIDGGRADLAKSYFQSVTDMQNKRETQSKNNSEIATNNALAIALGQPTMPLSVEDARMIETPDPNDPKKTIKPFDMWYKRVLPKEQAFFDKYFRAPKTTSLQAAQDMDEFLASGSDDRIRFNRLLSPLSTRARQNSILRYAGIRTDLKDVDNSKIDKTATLNAYIMEMTRANKLDGDLYDTDDAEEMYAVRAKLEEWIRLSNATIPSVNSEEGIKNMQNFIEYHARDANKIPTFLGGKRLKAGSTTDAQDKAEAYRKKRERSKI